MTDTTELTREEVEALLAGATPGPWQVLEDGRSRVTLMHVETAEGCPAGIGLPVTSIPRKREPDADLIAAAPTLARQLLATMDELAEARATLAAALAGFTEQGHPGRPCVRHGWVSVEQVEKWRTALTTMEPPDAD